MKENLKNVFSQKFDIQSLGSKTELKKDQVPDFVMQKIQIPESDVYLLRSNDGIDTYISVWSSPDNKKIYGRVIDVAGSRIVGQTSYLNSPLEEDGPSIGSTYTNPDYQRKGLAARRTAVINSICKDMLGRALSSSNVRTPDADAFWGRLVAEGLAIETTTPAGKKTFKLL